MRCLFLSVILILTVGCSSRQVKAPQQDVETALRAYSDQIDLCVGAWQPIVDDWVEQGGRIDEDIDSTRERIAGDRVSTFAALIRSVWSRQVAAGTDLDRSYTFMEALESRNVVPESCTPLVWAEEVLASSPAAISPDTITSLQKKLGIEDDRVRATSWAMSQLLISPANAPRHPQRTP
ncbi:hypothetical protein [Stenotrophomonas rhizophila]|jgi:hypothetical protein|uniref:hypothetical protein n=1 Tax=Stenotrophomonas rhizophila TaxID=216778 RepID=UPI000456E2DC|nr:hypothetical protein [Stenotrophomonas rhizophila]AHY57491.1 hypothetical protein DX03_02065 [Stenotrophomonas rhizophila]